MGVVRPAEGFLEGLREITRRPGTLLIFDEVITGFRLCYGGAQSLYKIEPDLTTLGKIIGGGLPVAAYGGRAEIMNHLAPLGAVYQAGTLSGNPLAMRAGIEALKQLEEAGFYDALKRPCGIMRTQRNQMRAASLHFFAPCSSRAFCSRHRNSRRCSFPLPTRRPTLTSRFRRSPDG